MEPSYLSGVRLQTIENLCGNRDSPGRLNETLSLSEALNLDEERCSSFWGHMETCYTIMWSTNIQKYSCPSLKSNCTLNNKKINRPNVSQGCMAHYPSVNSQLIRCAVDPNKARRQKASRTLHHHETQVRHITTHFTREGNGRQICVNTKPTDPKLR